MAAASGVFESMAKSISAESVIPTDFNRLAKPLLLSFHSDFDIWLIGDFSFWASSATALTRSEVLWDATRLAGLLSALCSVLPLF